MLATQEKQKMKGRQGMPVINEPEVDAYNMADIMEEHTEDGIVNDEGLELLKDYFTDVLPEDRALVFENFLDELEKRGIAYRAGQFAG